MMIRKYIPEPIKEVYRRIRPKILSIGLVSHGTFEQPIDELEASKDMSIIVPIFDSPEFLIRCLNSLEIYASYAEIILVDDGSAMQETLNILEDFHRRKNWPLIRNNNSIGHSRACEAGARFATRPYLCFLNSDTVVTPWSWSAAKHAFETDPRIAVTGPSTSWAFTKQVIREARYCRHYWNDCQIFAFAQKYVKRQKNSKLVDLPEISGFAFFIRRQIWEKFGGFDKKLPDYGNETELCLRLSKSGWRLVWVQNSYIHHFGNLSYGKAKDSKSNYAIRYIKDKHGDCLNL
jgi:GT2 family glycosyltransferase